MSKYEDGGGDGDENSKQNSKRVGSLKRRRRLPPMRLTWPGEVGGKAVAGAGAKSMPTIGAMTFLDSKALTKSASLNGQKSNTGNKEKRTRNPRTSTSGSSAITSRSYRGVHGSKNEMWIDKYKPTHSKSLCVAPKKVKEVNEWLQQQQKKFDESTSVAEARTGMNSTYYSQKGLNPDAKLLILVGKPGIGKSTMIHILCEELNLSVLEWNDNYTGEFESGWGRSRESQIAMFEEFLTSASFQYEPVSGLSQNDTHDYSDGRKEKGSIVMIDELPNLHSKNSERLFRDVMTRYLQKTQTPTILIFSDVTEGKHKPEDLERLFDTELLSSSLVQILQINAVTRAKMKTMVKDILKQERINIKPGVANAYYEELFMESEGDLRHAINRSQFYFADRSWASSPLHSVQGSSQKRDTKLSTFHALGKLLYAKRMTVEDAKKSILQKHVGDNDYHDRTWNRDLRPPLQFHPERALEGGDISITGAMSFVQFHSPDFFTDITDLSKAFERFSDSEILSRPSFPEEYATSLCSRAVGDANKHPAPSKFRQLTAPKIFEVMRKKAENTIKFEQIRRRLSLKSNHLSLDANTRSSSQFATEELPFIKNTIPEVVNIETSLYSNSNYIVLDENNRSDVNNQILLDLEQQRNVLMRDDIVDYSDDDSDPDKELVTPRQQLQSNTKSDPICQKLQNITKPEPDIIVIE